MTDHVQTHRSKAERVAQILLGQIVESGIAPGQTFGTELDLLNRFQVSRPTLRESLRILESQGVLELRPGNKVTLATLRTVIKNNGFVSKDAQVTARGSIDST